MYLYIFFNIITKHIWNLTLGQRLHPTKRFKYKVNKKNQKHCDRLPSVFSVPHYLLSLWLQLSSLLNLRSLRDVGEVLMLWSDCHKFIHNLRSKIHIFKHLNKHTPTLLHRDVQCTHTSNQFDSCWVEGWTSFLTHLMLVISCARGLVCWELPNITKCSEVRPLLCGCCFCDLCLWCCPPPQSNDRD